MRPSLAVESSPVAVSDAVAGQALEIPLELISANRRQPREIFDEEALQGLADSIKEQGVLQPVVVRQVEGGYELVAGERRLRASKLAGMATIPAVVTNISDDRMLEAALVENIQREDLNVIEVAHSFQALINDLHLTHEDVAKRLGVSRASVSNILRLLSLPREVQEIVSRGTLSMGHARALAGLENPMQQINLARRFEQEGLSVREAERLVQQTLGSPKHKKDPAEPSTATPGNAIIRDFEDRLRQHFGTKVKIEDRGGQGVITLEYYSPADFGRIIAVCGLPDA